MKVIYDKVQKSKGKGKKPWGREEERTSPPLAFGSITREKRQFRLTPQCEQQEVGKLPDGRAHVA